MVATFKLHQKSFKLWILKWALYKCFQIMDVLCHFEYKHSWFQHSLGLKVALAESGLCKNAQTPSSPGDSYGTWTFLQTCFSHKGSPNQRVLVWVSPSPGPHQVCCALMPQHNVQMKLSCWHYQHMQVSVTVEWYTVVHVLHIGKILDPDRTLCLHRSISVGIFSFLNQTNILFFFLFTNCLSVKLLLLCQGKKVLPAVSCRTDLYTTSFVQIITALLFDLQATDIMFAQA